MQLTLPVAFSLSKYSTIVRLYAQTLARRVALRGTALLAPELASLWAERLFLTPLPASNDDWPADLLAQAQPLAIRHGSIDLAAWRWGAPDAPTVLLVHGWGGLAAQWQHFVRPLLAAGFAAIAYDQPAHGRSQGRLTGLPDFGRALLTVAARQGRVHGVIAHSLGGPALAYALANGLNPERAVLISPPSDLVGYSYTFARWLWLPESIRAAMQAAVEERFGVRWEDIALERLKGTLDTPALFVHCRDDRIVAVEQGRAFAEHWSHARLLLRQRLGHGRILRDAGTVAAACDFLRGDDRIGEPAATALPHPAPLY
jgi:alpha-beta hydrolase superfamily lysophospholipase